MRRLLFSVIALISLGSLAGCGIGQQRHRDRVDGGDAYPAGPLQQRRAEQMERYQQMMASAAASKSGNAKSDSEPVIYNMSSKEIVQPKVVQTVPIYGDQNPSAFPAPVARKPQHPGQGPMHIPSHVPPVESTVTIINAEPTAGPDQGPTIVQGEPRAPVLPLQPTSVLPDLPIMEPTVTTKPEAPIQKVEAVEAPKLPVVRTVKEPPVEAKPTPVQTSADAKTFTGQAQQWRKSWRIRYAGVDQDDEHGGSLVLEGGLELDQLRDGQRIRVRGTVIPAESASQSSRLRVQSLEKLD